MEKLRIAILKNEDPLDHLPWVDACASYKDQVTASTIDLSRHDWLSEIQKFEPDVCVLKPSGLISRYRTMYQERIEIITMALGIPSYPTLDELRIYENKKYFAYWAGANEVPHPKTWVFYDSRDASQTLKSVSFPLVGKVNIGASGNGVVIIKDATQLQGYLQQAFGKGLTNKTGPKLGKGKILKRMLHMIFNPAVLKQRLKVYSAISADKQVGLAIIQEFIRHDFEWRVVRIGDSFFAHKKLKLGDKASGSLIKDYGDPPLDLLGFVRELTDRFCFKSVAVDLFVSETSEYLINEIQCIFGQSDGFQMMVEGIIGRYIFYQDQWLFQKGDYARNACYNLRVEQLIENHKRLFS